MDTRKSRINYGYLAKLRDRLLELGHDIHEIPIEFLLEHNWHEHRAWIESSWELPYCVRCKLPTAPADMDEGFTNICSQHGLLFRDVIAMRQARVHERKMAKMEARAAEFVTLVEERDAEIARQRQADEHPEIPIVDVSKREQRTKILARIGNYNQDIDMNKLFDTLHKRSKPSD